MSLTLSHPLHKQPQRFTQGECHRDAIVYKFRNLIDDLLIHPSRRSFRKTVKGWNCSINCPAQDQRDETELVRFKAVSARLLKKKVEAFTAFVTEQRCLALHALSTSPQVLTAGSDQQTLQQSAMTLTLVLFVADVPLPPGATIRSTPRRPGAPSALLPH